MNQDDKNELKNLYCKIWQGLLTKNISELEKIHDKNFILVHMTGM